MYKVPLEIGAIVKKQTFYVESFLSAMNPQTDVNNYYPLMIHGMYSRYSLCLINEEKRPATANITVREMKNIKKDETKLSAAYTVKISSGTLKGRTPAQVLLEDGETGKGFLSRQYDWLGKNLNKYKNNQIQMDAIAEAINLYNSGRLNQDAVDSTNYGSVILYEAKSRVNIHKQRADGMCPVRDVMIRWDFGAANPVTVFIRNYYAPFRRNEQGLTIACPNERDESTLVTNTMNFTDEEWMCIIDNIRISLK